MSSVKVLKYTFDNAMSMSNIVRMTKIKFKLSNEFFFCFRTYQFNSIAGFFERIDGRCMGNVDNWHLIHLEYRVIDTQTAVCWCRTAWYKFCDINCSIVAKVRIVSTTGDAKSQTRATALQYDFFVLPVIIPVCLLTDNHFTY